MHVDTNLNVFDTDLVAQIILWSLPTPREKDWILNFNKDTQMWLNSAIDTLRRVLQFVVQLLNTVRFVKMKELFELRGT